MKKTKMVSLLRLLKEEVKKLVEAEDKIEDGGLEVSTEETPSDDFSDIDEELLQNLSSEYSQKLIEMKDKLAEEAFQKLVDKELLINTINGSVNVIITKAYWGWPRGWKRSRLAPLSHCSSRLRSQGNLVSKSARWLGTLGISSASCLACCSTSGSSREMSRPPKVTSTTSSIARAVWRLTGRMRRSRVTGTSRATARTIEPKSTSNTQRSSQASSPSTTRARKPIRMRAFMEGLVGVGVESMDQGCPESRLRAG